MMQNIYVLNIDSNCDNRFDECLVTKEVFERLYKQLNDNDSSFVKIETIDSDILNDEFLDKFILTYTSLMMYQYELKVFINTLFEDICEIEMNSFLELLENKFDNKLDTSPFLECVSACYIFNKNAIDNIDIKRIFY